MSDNITVKNATGVTETVRTTDTAGVHTPHQNAQLMVGGGNVTDENPVPVNAEFSAALHAMINMLGMLVMSQNPANGMLRVTVDAGTLPTVTTCNTVTNITQIGGQIANNLLADAMYNQYANGVRAQIS
jgi:hypothetical protein